MDLHADPSIGGPGLASTLDSGAIDPNSRYLCSIHSRKCGRRSGDFPLKGLVTPLLFLDAPHLVLRAGMFGISGDKGPGGQ